MTLLFGQGVGRRIWYHRPTASSHVPRLSATRLRTAREDLTASQLQCRSEASWGIQCGGRSPRYKWCLHEGGSGGGGGLKQPLTPQVMASNPVVVAG